MRVDFFSLSRGRMDRWGMRGAWRLRRGFEGVGAVDVDLGEK